mmetsp:Transcript_12990/g.30357  ORF Transcript_12990/g.30357 Transcript_12990/m.30357 type:complete len:225 (-) Transcript_12990:1041-1715(-)
MWCSGGGAAASAAAPSTGACAAAAAAALLACLMAKYAASRTKAARSAPLKPGESLAKAGRSTSGASGSFLECVFRMSSRPASDGRGTKRRRSNRPGRSIAGSMMSGRLVAAITKTCERCWTPSISVSIWLTTRSAELEPSAERRGTRASSSSKKMTQGAELRARWKTRRTARSDSPTYLFSSSGPLIAMKLAPLAFAAAFASSVLPQPGGPKSSTPTGTVRPQD